MMRWFYAWRLRRWKRRHQGFSLATVPVGDAEYHVRELTVAERMAFRDYVAENENNGTLAIAWLARTACFEFSRTSIIRLSTTGPPTALARVSTAALEVSGMTPEDSGMDDARASVADDGYTVPGTVEDAKKN